MHIYKEDRGGRVPLAAALRGLLAGALAVSLAPLPGAAPEALALEAAAGTGAQGGLAVSAAPAAVAGTDAGTGAAASGGWHASHGEQAVVAEYDAGSAGAVRATLYADGCLVFSGRGLLDAVGSFGGAPWFHDVAEARTARIVRVEFGEGVAGADLSRYFIGCADLEEVANFPYGVSSLGSSAADGAGAFYCCTSLVRVADIPATVTSMDQAFYGCTSLAEAPAVPARVGDMARCFAYCRSLASAPLLPAGATDIDRCFEGCWALRVLPAGWAFPGRTVPAASVFGGAAGPDGELLATYCDAADYPALSRAVYWSDAGRSLEPLADFSGVEGAEGRAAGIDRGSYTAESLAALDAALAAVDRARGASAQAEVDAMAAALEEALAALEPLPADYSGVEAALALVPGDLSGYTRESAAAALSAAASVDRSLSVLEQGRVDAMARGLASALAGLERLADYSAVDAALGSVPADLSAYTEASARAVRSAVAAVVRGKGESAQGAVDGWAASIARAVAALAERSPQVVAAGDVSATFGCAPFPLVARASGGGALSYAVTSGGGVARVSRSGVVTVTGAGVATVRVTAAATGGFLAGERTVTVRVAKAGQSISCKAKARKSFAGKGSGAGRRLAKKRTFGLAGLLKPAASTGVVYEKVSGSSKVRVGRGGKVTVKKGLRKGTHKVRVRLSAPGDANHEAAPERTVTVKVVVR